MKQLEEVLEWFPQESFSDVFKSRISDLMKRTSTEEQKHAINEMVEVYNQICDFFDNTIEYLKETIKDHIEYEIDDLEAEEIEKVLNEYNQNIAKLTSVDIGTPDFETAKNQLNNQVSSIANTYRKNDEKQSSLKRFILAEIQSIKIKPILNNANSDVLEKALDVAKKLNSKINIIDSAQQAAESLLGKREHLIKEDVQKRVSDLNEKANSHNNRQIWAWFIAGCVLGLLAVAILFALIHGFTIGGMEVIKSSSDLTLGPSTLRLALVSVVLYFAFYCMKQFSIHRHLYELYSFKETALQVMINLRGESDELEKKLILAKGLEAIFSEPSTGLVASNSDHSGDYWQTVQRILERIVTKNVDSN